MHLKHHPWLCAGQILHRTVALNVMKGEDVESSLEEVVKQRQFTVQVSCGQKHAWAVAAPAVGQTHGMQ